MNKYELVTFVAESTGLGRVDSGRALDAALEAIQVALRAGDDVRLVGFGTFHVTHRKALSGRNPRTGDPMLLGASNQPKFTPGKLLKAAVN
ncbi:HU family DNA-binding protein [Polymorphobacter sp. PAMC 29334]|uniref:HU family DNA-binding protein n=1 Tax=Polymorphobacter sp. PAMC 29334 TaxID=2862331 RepID=UPI001C678DCB|nr:HU family DNA-binding protein [Polymorphobacter sp. PAMC 29334]QYE34142.1 HU family DNA-binding protein [Polymorphobacter sp. PAMC 29334]